jgi:hypothetical protein
MCPDFSLFGLHIQFAKLRSTAKSACHVFWSQCVLRFLAYALPGGGVAALNRTLSGTTFSQVIVANAKVNAV